MNVIKSTLRIFSVFSVIQNIIPTSLVIILSLHYIKSTESDGTVTAPGAKVCNRSDDK